MQKKIFSFIDKNKCFYMYFFYLVGMPMYKNPFEKGQLIIQFLVNFPERIPPVVIPALENCLPPRPRVSSRLDFTNLNSFTERKSVPLIILPTFIRIYCNESLIVGFYILIYRKYFQYFSTIESCF